MPFQKNIPMICGYCGKAFLAARPASTRPPTKFCSAACYHKSQVRPLAEAFWEKVNKTEGCWLWTGNKTKAGYGMFRNAGVQRYAHRTSWELHFGDIPTNLHVCHHCDVPACVRPDHLFVGTPTDNMQDMIAKGRGNCLSRGENPKLGEDHPNAVLTAAAIPVIRCRVAAGESHYKLAAEYGVSRPTITAVANRRLWKHIP